jgi:molecular chaperone GrpE (heat shock protein)
MNDDQPAGPPPISSADLSESAAAVRGSHTIGASSLYRLCEELIAVRETTSRQHKVFEQSLAKTRDALQSSFSNFAADTQRAYQQLRQEFHGEKRIGLALLNELLEVSLDLERIVAARPTDHHPEALARWVESVDVESRKVQAAVLRHGIHPYDAVIGSAYNPALHERVGSRRMEGMDALRVAEQREHGYASKQPEFVLRRSKVIVSE